MLLGPRIHAAIGQPDHGSAPGKAQSAHRPEIMQKYSPNRGPAVVEHVIAAFFGTLMPGVKVIQESLLVCAMEPKPATARRMPPFTKLVQTCVRTKSPTAGVVNTVCVWFGPVRSTVAVTIGTPCTLLTLLLDRFRLLVPQAIDVHAIDPRATTAKARASNCFILGLLVRKGMRLSISTRHDDTARRGIARPNSVPLPRSHVSRFLDVADSYSGTACPRGSLHARGASPLCGALLSEPPRARQSLSCAFTSSPLSAVRRL